jgi:hypothetical protein
VEAGCALSRWPSRRGLVVGGLNGPRLNLEGIRYSIAE